MANLSWPEPNPPLTEAEREAFALFEEGFFLGHWKFETGIAPLRNLVVDRVRAAERARFAPRMWSTEADLRALPVDSVVRDAEGCVWERVSDEESHEWRSASYINPYTPVQEVAGYGPGLILYTPEPAP